MEPYLTVKESMESVAEKCGVDRDAVWFCFAELQRCRSRGRIVDCEEFVWLLHDQAIVEFSGSAIQQLNNWGIFTTADFGRVVVAMTEAGLAAMSDDDSFEQFENVFKFGNEFQSLKIKPPPVYSSQFRIATLIQLTTIAAILIAGYAKGGFDGAMSHLLASWTAILGVTCITIAIIYKNIPGLVLLILGAVLFGFGFIQLFT